MPKWSTLFTAAGALGLGIGVLGLAIHQRMEKFANESKFIKGAIATMRQQPEVKELLGENISVGTASFDDKWSKMEKKHVQIRVPVKGENSNAYLYAYGRKLHENDTFKLFKVEATFDKIAGKRLVILDRTDEEDESEEEERIRKEQEEEEFKRKRRENFTNRNSITNWEWKDKSRTDLAVTTKNLK